jgi:hypothetical protein
MERRRFFEVIAGALLAAPLAAEAQQAGKVPRIGFLGTRSPSDTSPDPLFLPVVSSQLIPKACS